MKLNLFQVTTSCGSDRTGLKRVRTALFMLEFFHDKYLRKELACLITVLIADYITDQCSDNFAPQFHKLAMANWQVFLR